ncbi:transposase [Caldicellulosiruptor morganii]|uniref:transposase n=1 Tax=Caldicellulosiruptor morganii TaxID=1387555 RepID=UPI003A5C267F
MLGFFSNFIDLNQFIPASFFKTYYKYFGRQRDFSLQSMLCAFFVQKILKLTTLTWLRAILLNSYQLRIFCNFNKIPSIFTFSRFRKIFCHEIEKLFYNIANYTTALEPRVKENNSKFIQSQLKKTKSQNIELQSHLIYFLTYSNLPQTASASPYITRMFANGHFCYAYKFSILTSGFGIPLVISPAFTFPQNNASDLSLTLKLSPIQKL